MRALGASNESLQIARGRVIERHLLSEVLVGAYRQDEVQGALGRRSVGVR